MNWKAQLGIGLLVVAVAVAGVWMWRDSVWRGRILNAPATRDTSIVVVRDTVEIPVLRADTVYVRQVDSTATTPRWWVAKADTVIDGARIHLEYNSPLPLSARGFFSDFSVQLPPRIDSVRTVYVTETRTVYEETVAWEATVITGSVCLVLGAFLMGVAQ